MKKQHIILILLLAIIAAYFLNEGRKLKGSESIARNELNLLRDAVKNAPGTTSSTNAGRGSRPPAMDSTKFLAELTDLLAGGSNPENAQKIQEFIIANGSQLESAPLSKIKEIIDGLEKKFPFDQEGTEGAQFLWFNMVRLAAKADPTWAFAKLDQASSTFKIPLNMQLEMLKQPLSQDGGPMSLAYATALQKWLDSAQAAGRIEESDPLVAALRADIAAAQGDQSAAVKQISQLTNRGQRQAAMDYLKGLPTPEAQRRGMEELSTILDFYNFTAAVRSLAAQQGFEEAKDILSSASLTPDKYDMAAASIAAAKIGPETKDRAAWLLENLRSDDRMALELFASSWTAANHPDAANWIATLPPGPQRDGALGGFIPTAARIDGATAMDWALTVSDPLLRNQLYCEARGKWQETDPQQANAYSKSHPLDMEAVKAASKFSLQQKPAQ